MPAPDLIIVGASVRAAAVSALRAGLRPWCIDLFADADLRAIAPVVRCPPGQYPHALPELLREAPESPWMYTGGLENHPDLVRRMAEIRPLWGNGPDALMRARSPFFVHRLLTGAGLPCPEVRHPGRELAGDCRWLRKPLRGAGGNGIAFAESSRPPEGVKAEEWPVYFQQHVEGQSLAAVYAATADGALLLGVSVQLVGAPWLNAKPFRYCGSVGALEPAPETAALLRRYGEVLAEGCGLRGLFGVDFVSDKDRLWPVEVNPRYSASVEVLECAAGFRALAFHRGACGAGRLPPSPPLGGETYVSKVVFFAPRSFAFPADGPWRDYTRKPPLFLGVPDFADIPDAGEIIEAGWPVLTLLERRSKADSTWDGLRSRVERLSRLLFAE